ncbi:MAG: glycosyltransferase family 2 protein, partial [Waterburya sp.]
MNQLVIIILIGLVSLTILHIHLTSVFVSSFRSTYQSGMTKAQLPKVAIALCLRGADPFLSQCLQALFKQNYPNYELRIIVDSIQDPAWEIAHNISQQALIPVQ